MKSSHELQLPLIDQLPHSLITPKRFGIALAPVVELYPLPETARVFDFPVQPETGK